MSITTELFFRLLRVSFGTTTDLGRVPSEEEWKQLLQMAREQTVAGVAFSGIERLPQEQRPPRAVLLQWYAMVEQIRRQNELLNRRSVEATAFFRRLGYRSCILKGQANATQYPDPLRRTPGDIDIWVEGERRELIALAREHCEVKGGRRKVPVQFHDVDIDLFPDVEVELHFYPTMLFCPWRHFRLQRVMRSFQDEAMTNAVVLPGGVDEICMLPARPNLLLQIIHLRKHLIAGGVGMRHVIDFFCLLRSVQPTPALQRDLSTDLHRLQLRKFGAALAYVLRESLGADDKMLTLLPSPDAKHGAYLLNEILCAGNFGHYDKRKQPAKASQGLPNFIRLTREAFHSLRHYPMEALFNPLYRVAQFVWRQTL